MKGLSYRLIEHARILKPPSYVQLTYALTLLILISASQQFSYSCPFHTVFGIYCPGCGSIRAMRDLLHGSIGQAWHNNALLFISPLCIVFGIRLKKDTSAWRQNLFLIFLTILVIAFTVTRNSCWPALSPLNS